jgi:hypothetical protein
MNDDANRKPQTANRTIPFKPGDRVLTKTLIPALHTVKPPRPAIQPGTRCRIVEVLQTYDSEWKYRAVTDSGIEFYPTDSYLTPMYVQGKLF